MRVLFYQQKISLAVNLRKKNQIEILGTRSYSGMRAPTKAWPASTQKGKLKTVTTYRLALSGEKFTRLDHFILTHHDMLLNASSPRKHLRFSSLDQQCSLRAHYSHHCK